MYEYQYRAPGVVLIAPQECVHPVFHNGFHTCVAFREPVCADEILHGCDDMDVLGDDITWLQFHGYADE